MAKKDKDKSKDKSKTKDDNNGEFLFNPSALAKTLSMLKTMMGNADMIDIMFSGKKVYCHSVTPRGSILLINTDAVKEGKGSLSFRLPGKMWSYATDRKAELRLTRGTGNKSSYIIFHGTRYEVELHFSDPEVDFKSNSLNGGVENGTTAEPVVALISNCGHALGMTNYVTGQGLPISMRWAKGKVEAAKMSPWHGAVFTGAVEKGIPDGKMSVPPEIVNQLALMGGNVGLKGNNIAITSDLGIAEFAQIDTTGAPVNLDQALQLAKREFPGSVVVNGPELSQLIANSVNVTESGNHITLSFNKKEIRLTTTGRYGNVSGDVETTDTVGKLPKEVHIAPSVLSELSALLDRPVRLHISDKTFKIEPVKPDEWNVVGYGCYFNLDK